MSCIACVVEEIIDSVVDLVIVGDVPRPFAVNLSTARNDRQLPLKHALWRDASVRDLPSDETDHSHKCCW